MLFLRDLIIAKKIFLSWKALIYYLYTGKVSFSHLKSQKLQQCSAVDSDREEYVSAAIPLCSPKSMYQLADEVCLHRKLKILP